MLCASCRGGTPAAVTPTKEMTGQMHGAPLLPQAALPPPPQGQQGPRGPRPGLQPCRQSRIAPPKPAPQARSSGPPRRLQAARYAAPARHGENPPVSYRKQMRAESCRQQRPPAARTTCWHPCDEWQKAVLLGHPATTPASASPVRAAQVVVGGAAAAATRLPLLLPPRQTHLLPCPRLVLAAARAPAAVVRRPEQAMLRRCRWGLIAGPVGCARSGGSARAPMSQEKTAQRPWPQVLQHLHLKMLMPAQGSAAAAAAAAASQAAALRRGPQAHLRPARRMPLGRSGPKGSARRPQRQDRPAQ